MPDCDGMLRTIGGSRGGEGEGRFRAVQGGNKAGGEGERARVKRRGR
jgi:hypothetical protein